MPLIVCPQPACARRVQVAEGALPATLRCPYCGQVFQVPEQGCPAPAPAASPGSVTAVPAATLPIPAAHLSGKTPTSEGSAPPAATMTLPAAESATGPTRQAPAASGSPQATLTDSPGGLATPAPDTPPSRIGRFEVRQRLGEGAFGVVYRAYDAQLDREVALKVAKPHMLNTEARVKRFLREAKAAANLRHPNIVPVHDSGKDGEQYYIASAFIPGQSLAGVLGDQPAGLEPRQAAEVVRKLAEALAYAHGKGVIHRDVKPANVMLDEQGEPLLMDFGLAARADGDEKLTQEATAMGTPAYMAPEQAAGKAEAASDQYSLGCTLYELLTGQTPFSGPPELQIFLHQTQDPPRLRAANPQVPRDLETVCLKAMARQPAERYADCQALANDLRRWREGEAILARRESVLARVWRRVRRNRLLTASLLVGLLGLILAGVVTAYFLQYRSIERLHQDFQTELASLDGTEPSLLRIETRIAALERLSPDRAAAARAALAQRLADWLHERLSSGRLEPEDRKAIDEALRLLAARDPGLADAVRAARTTRYRQQEPVLDVRTPFAGAAELFATHQVNAADRNFLLPGTRRLATTDGNQASTVLTRVACKGNALLEAELLGPWDDVVTVGLLLYARDGHSGTVNALAFAPDGQTLVTAGDDETLRIWNTATGQETAARLAHKGGVMSIAFAPGGRLLATGGNTEDRVHLWDVSGWKIQSSLPSIPEGVYRLTFAADGQTLAAQAGTHPIHLWDRAAGKMRELSGHQGEIRCLQFAPQGQTLAAGGDDQTLRLWDAATGALRHAIGGQPAVLVALAFAPQGGVLASGDAEGRVRLWDTAAGKEIATLQAERLTARALAFSPDGQALAVSTGSSVTIWDLASRKVRVVVPLPTDVQALAYAPDGRGLAAGLMNGTTVLLDLVTGRHRHTFGAQSYTFLLSSAGAKHKGPAKSLTEVRRAGGLFSLQILRNGVLQREEACQVPDGPLRLAASREGDLLKFQVNDRAPMLFRDVLPGGPSEGVFGLYWPAGVRLARLSARQAPPPDRSPLEKGDDLYARGQYAEALAFYQAQARTSGASDSGRRVRREAECKTGLCLTALQRYDEAAAVLEPVALAEGQPGEPWPLVSVFQLWLLHLRSNRFNDAEQLFANVRVRYPDFNEVAAFIPDDVRAQILHAYLNVKGSKTAVLLTPEQLAPFERSVAVGDAFQAVPVQRIGARHALLRACCLAGKEERALEVGREAMQLIDKLAIDELGFALNVPEDYCWLLRRRGRTAEALELTNRWLVRSGKQFTRVSDDFAARMLLTRARVHVALQAWDPAVQDLEEALTCPDLEYGTVSQVCLLLGFLHEQRGDAAAAAAAWKRGRYWRWKQAPTDAERLSFFTDYLSKHSFTLLNYLMLASLTNDLSDAEGEAALALLLSVFGNQAQLKQFLSLLHLPPALVGEMWRTPRGRKCARQMAFRDLSYAESLRLPACLFAAEVARRGAFADAPTPEQDDLLWQAIEEGLLSYARGELNSVQTLQLGLAWKGTTNSFGWAGVAPTLKPALRGPAAYLLGLRYQRLDRPKDAVAFLQRALTDAPADSALQRQTQAELKRLGEK